MDKKQVVCRWAYSGIYDLFLEYCLSETFFYSKNFFFSHGLEKLCKAYILSLESLQYEQLPDNDAEFKIDKIVREYNHDLVKMIKRLIKAKVFEENILTDIWAGYYGAVSTGEDIAKQLTWSCKDGRYPFAKQKSPMSSLEINVTSEPGDFAYALGRILNNKIESEFDVSTLEYLQEKLSFFEDDNKAWIRFCRLFYEKEAVFK